MATHAAGQVPALRDGVLAVVKIGMVLVLATSWPAFRTLAYDVTMRGPAELAASIGGGAGLPGADGGLAPRLQRIDNGLVELIELGTGKPDNADEVVGPSAVPLTPSSSRNNSRGCGNCRSGHAGIATRKRAASPRHGRST